MQVMMGGLISFCFSKHKFVSNIDSVRIGTLVCKLIFRNGLDDESNQARSRGHISWEESNYRSYFLRSLIYVDCYHVDGPSLLLLPLCEETVLMSAGRSEQFMGNTNLPFFHLSV